MKLKKIILALISVLVVGNALAEDPYDINECSERYTIQSAVDKLGNNEKVILKRGLQLFVKERDCNTEVHTCSPWREKLIRKKGFLGRGYFKNGYSFTVFLEFKYGRPYLFFESKIYNDSKVSRYVNDCGAIEDGEPYHCNLIAVEWHRDPSYYWGMIVKEVPISYAGHDISFDISIGPGCIRAVDEFSHTEGVVRKEYKFALK